MKASKRACSCPALLKYSKRFVRLVIFGDSELLRSLICYTAQRWESELGVRRQQFRQSGHVSHAVSEPGSRVAIVFRVPVMRRFVTPHALDPVVVFWNVALPSG